MGILQLPPSVTLSPPNRLRPSGYLLLNHWTKSNQIWCVSCSHEWGMPLHIIFGPTPWEGTKWSNIIKFQLQSQFQIFLNQTLCVFSQMKDIKHIRWDFHFVAWVIRVVCPRGKTWGVLDYWGVGGGWGGVKNYFFQNSTKFGV